MFRARVPFPGMALRPNQAALGADHELLRVGIQRFGDEAFADFGTVAVGGIEEVVPELERARQQALGAIAVFRLAPDVGTTDTHGAEPQSVDGKIAELHFHRRFKLTGTRNIGFLPFVNDTELPIAILG